MIVPIAAAVAGALGGDLLRTSQEEKLRQQSLPFPSGDLFDLIPPLQQTVANALLTVSDPGYLHKLAEQCDTNAGFMAAARLRERAYWAEIQQRSLAVKMAPPSAYAHPVVQSGISANTPETENSVVEAKPTTSTNGHAPKKAVVKKPPAVVDEVAEKTEES